MLENRSQWTPTSQCLLPYPKAGDKSSLLGPQKLLSNVSIPTPASAPKYMWVAKKSLIPESQLIKFLYSYHCKDIYCFFFSNTQNFTFQRANIQSRIDQIWTNLSITNIKYTDILTDTILKSDHKIIILEISIIINKPKPYKQQKRKCFL